MVHSAELPTGRNHFAVGAIGGKVYVAGGRFGGGFNSEKTAALEIYDPAAMRWRPGRLMPSRRGGVAGVVANECLYVIGGEGNTTDPRGLFDQNEAYDPQTNSWRRLAPMPTPTHGLGGAVFVNGRIHLPGGAVTQGGGSGSVIHWTFRPLVTCHEHSLAPPSGGDRLVSMAEPLFSPFGGMNVRPEHGSMPAGVQNYLNGRPKAPGTFPAGGDR